MTRLESLAPDLAEKLRCASLDRQRVASVAACEFAITRAKLEHPLVEQVLDKMRVASVLTEVERAELDSLAAQLDEEYFAIQEPAEKKHVDPEGYMRAFSQSRAVTALSIAGGGDQSQAAEVIYEAMAAVDDKDELAARILAVLR